MSYTQAEKLQILLLCDIHKALGIKDSFNPEIIEEAIHSDNTWALSWKYQVLNDGSPTPQHVKLVVDTLDMFDILKYTYSRFSEEDKEEVASAVPHFRGEDSLEFPGFDGNNETDFMSVGAMLKLMGKFRDTGFDLTKNSHSPYVETYRRMLGVFLSARANDWTHDVGISKESFITVLLAKIHPSNR